ncbi:MAG: hypothetical protein U5J98_05485 [Halobacteriales archaeon]|nr:hypothetical protein [Halobacteriales archaeon]
MLGHAALAPMQIADLASVLELSPLVRVPIAVGLVVALGAVLLWRYEGVVERSIDASTARPVAALGYGVAAHATLLFAGAYLTSQLAQLTLSGRSLGVLGLWIGGLILAVTAALGFTVVGTVLIELRGAESRWQGLAVGAALAGVAAAFDPLIGGVIWLVAVSTGVGGPVRDWVWAAEDTQAVRAE